MYVCMVSEYIPRHHLINSEEELDRIPAKNDLQLDAAAIAEFNQELVWCSNAAAAAARPTAVRSPRRSPSQGRKQ